MSKFQQSTNTAVTASWAIEMLRFLSYWLLTLSEQLSGAGYYHPTLVQSKKMI